MNIGIDIGGTTIGIGAVDSENKTVFYSQIETDRSYSPFKIENAVISCLERELSARGVERADSIGIGIPGIVSGDRGRVLSCPNLGWKGVSFGEKLSAKFKAGATLWNDATAATYGEYSLGRMANYESGVMMTLGTGVGGGIVLNGEVFEGSNGAASELGHMTVGEGLYRCGCGRMGCLETFASGTALIKYMNKLKTENGDLANICSAKEVFDLYSAGDCFATYAVERFVHYLSIGIVNIISTLDPEIIVLGGGLSLSGDIYIEKLRESVSLGRYFTEIPPPEIELSSLDETSGAVGAALLGRKSILL